MDRWQRRPVLVVAHAGAAVGFAIAGSSFVAGSLAPFAVGTVLLAASIGAVYLTRLAAGEMFAKAERARAVAFVQVMATFGALLGPLLLVAADPIASFLGRSPDALVFFAAVPIFAVAAVLVAVAPEPMQIARQVPSPSPPSSSSGAASIPLPPLVAGIAALVCAQAAMVTIMGVAGAALRHEGHDAATTGLVMVAHFVGMFALSTVVGRVADRAGRRATILVGLATLGVGGLLVAYLPGAVGLAAGLLVVGLGWSFAYIGGTVVLTDVVPLARRARVLGLADLATSLLAAAASFAGGWWYGGHGLPSLGLLAALVVCAPLVLALPVREPTPGHYTEASPEAS
jgi:MFS family permease